MVGLPATSYRSAGESVRTPVVDRGGTVESRTATQIAWGYVREGVERALGLPGLPEEDQEALVKAHRFACRLADREDPTTHAGTPPGRA